MNRRAIALTLILTACAAAALTGCGFDGEETQSGQTKTPQFKSDTDSDPRPVDWYEMYKSLPTTGVMS